ncbi:hypothetical protein TESG_00147 [Trichophyton tonsurans CBS 112818]|uniref:Uncharacterized protein n=1 Tax=Trichophyton tonsurans (strain CBS 112818) TaxID=647933 RepID=F2RMM5_TRIT1|nr:hypothetical protein TESG_00147 [Trichophyton tonsurans CBS 112818]
MDRRQREAVKKKKKKKKREEGHREAKKKLGREKNILYFTERTRRSLCSLLVRFAEGYEDQGGNSIHLLTVHRAVVCRMPKRSKEWREAREQVLSDSISPYSFSRSLSSLRI